VTDEKRDADYHDAHFDDDKEWEGSSEEVEPRPSGMTVLSLRLPIAELSLLKQEAARRQTSMSELTRSALRLYLLPRATGSLSATSIHHLQVTTQIPTWVGGQAGPSTVQKLSSSATPSPTPA
jgi:hypothetical protein